MATDVLTVNAHCDKCDVTVTAVVIDDSMSSDVAEFFRAHTHCPPVPAPTSVPSAAPTRVWTRLAKRGS